MINTPLSTSIGRFTGTSISTVIGFDFANTVTPFLPKSLFTEGNQGVWYDPSDKSTLFQDAAGTVPVTKDGDPVGLILDKSEGLLRGSELVINGGFDTADGWKLDNGWSIANGVATANTTLLSERISRDYKGKVGVYYEVKARITMLATPDARAAITINIGGLNEDLFIESAQSLISGQTYEIYGIAKLTNAKTFLLRVGTRFNYPANYTVDNISVKELKGNHAAQSISASRPIYKTDGTESWLYYDKVDDAMTVTLSAMTATVVIATDDGVSIDYPDTIGAGVYALTNNSTLGKEYGRLIVDRELTATEKTQITNYFNTKRGF